MEIASLLCDRGFGITIVDLSPSGLAEAKRRLEARRPSPAITIQTDCCDVTNAMDLAVAVRLHVSRHGGMNVMVNNAGIAEEGDFRNPAEASNWRAVVDVDLAAVVDGTRLGIDAMSGKGGGTIINVASAGGLFPMPFSPVYAAAKAGVVMFCRSIDEAVSDQDIAVRAFCPQFVDTAFVERASGEVARVHQLRGAPPSTSGGPSPLPRGGRGVGSAPTFDELIEATGGRLLTVGEAGLACVENLVDKPARSHASTALLLTTRGAKWWSFDGGAGRDGKAGQAGKEKRARL